MSRETLANLVECITLLERVAFYEKDQRVGYYVARAKAIRDEMKTRYADTLFAARVLLAEPAAPEPYGKTYGMENHSIETVGINELNPPIKDPYGGARLLLRLLAAVIREQRCYLQSDGNEQEAAQIELAAALLAGKKWKADYERG